MTPPAGRPPLFITFEGIDGAGKSTQVEAVARYLGEAGLPHLVTREPGGTVIGEAVRRVLLSRDNAAMSARAEVLLYLAARAQHVAEVIRPALDAGKIVLCDRFSDSTLAYQGYGLGLDLPFLTAATAWAAQGLWPDLTILLDLDPDLALRRRCGESQPDRIETRDLNFYRRVRQGYLELARAQTHRFSVVSAHDPPEKVAAAVLGRVRKALRLEEV